MEKLRSRGRKGYRSEDHALKVLAFATMRENVPRRECGASGNLFLDAGLHSVPSATIRGGSPDQGHYHGRGLLAAADVIQQHGSVAAGLALASWITH